MPVLSEQGLTKPIGSEIQVETLPEIYPPRGFDEDDAAWGTRVAAWGARTRTITYIIDDGSLLGVRQTTAAQAFNAEDETIQAAIEALAGIGAGNIKVSGDGRTFTYSFTGALANRGMRRMYSTQDNGIQIHFETIQQGYSEATQRAIKTELTENAVNARTGSAGTLQGSKAPKPADIGDPARYNPDGSPNQR